MNYFLKKILNKTKVYYYYLINSNSRQYFFILIWRKILSLFNNSKNSINENNFILSWCKKKGFQKKIFIKKLAYIHLLISLNNKNLIMFWQNLKKKN